MNYTLIGYSKSYYLTKFIVLPMFTIEWAEQMYWHVYKYVLDRYYYLTSHHGFLPKYFKLMTPILL